MLVVLLAAAPISQHKRIGDLLQTNGVQTESVKKSKSFFLHLFEKQAERERETDRQTVMKRDGQAGMVSTGSLSKCPQWPGG